MSERPLSAIVLAAGQGTRMRSSRPKPLHLLCGRAMVLYVLDAVAGCEIDRAVVVVGHGADASPRPSWTTPAVRLEFVEQHVQRGTGDAVAVGLTGLPDDDLDGSSDDVDVLVLPGDTPLLRTGTLAALVVEHRRSGAACTVLTARLDDPTGYGRIVRGKDDRVRRIVEHRDADADELEIDEINTGIFCFRRSLLAPALRRINPTTPRASTTSPTSWRCWPRPATASCRGRRRPGRDPRHQRPGPAGATPRPSCAAAPTRTGCAQGVTMVDPGTTYIDTTVVLAADVTLFPGTILQGRTVIGEGVEIGPATRLVDCTGGRAHHGQADGGPPGRHRRRLRGRSLRGARTGCPCRFGRRTGPFYTGVDRARS